MPTPESIRTRLSQLQKDNVSVHLTTVLPDRKGVLNSVPVQITGVYPHIFQVEQRSGAGVHHHTFPYTDVLIGHVKIDEII